DLHWIRQHFAQSAARQIRRTAWKIEDLLAGRSNHATAAPGPQARERTEERRLAGARRADDQHVLTGLQDDVLLLQYILAARRGDLEVFDPHRAGLAFLVGDAALEIALRFRREQGLAEVRDSQQRRAPIGNRAEVVDEPAQ